MYLDRRIQECELNKLDVFAKSDKEPTLLRNTQSGEIL